jgi:hypothetical protein
MKLTKTTWHLSLRVLIILILVTSNQAGFGNKIKIRMKNYYQILEVEPDTPQDKIKEQYLFLIQAWHPDKISNSAQKCQ